MKLRNKKTGEKGYFCFANWDNPVLIITDKNGVQLAKYNSLAELNEEWEDVLEESKEWYWFIEDNGIIQRSCHYEDLHPTLDKARKEIGNYFETEEEAEKAVRKLEAWKLLKDMGFKIEGIRYRNNKNYIEWSIPQKVRDDHFTTDAFNECLHLLFWR